MKKRYNEKNMVLLKSIHAHAQIQIVFGCRILLPMAKFYNLVFFCFKKNQDIRTYLHSTMSNERLAIMAILSIEREIAKEIPFDLIVDKFAAQDNNRKITLI